MTTALTLEHVTTLMESLNHSKIHIRDAQGTPYEIKQARLAQLEAAEKQLRLIRDSHNASA